MKRLLALVALSLLAGCSSFSFRPFGLVVCTSACTFDLKAPASAASAP
jgi:hypothetical protein